MRVKRIDLIEEFVLNNKTVSLDSLCEKFNVSKNTIRRDIETLVEKGSIKKVYGGVVSNNDSSEYTNILTSFEDRKIFNESEKDTICRIASSFINENDIVYVDTGTTCVNIIKYIADKKCTILTNSLQVCISAIPYPNINIITLPGKLKRETLSFVGSDLNEYLKTYNINKAFMTCTGLTIENGMTNASIEEYIIKKNIVSHSKKIFLMADNSKFDKVSLMTYSSLSEIDYLITDKKPSINYISYCKDNNIEIVTP